MAEQILRAKAFGLDMTISSAGVIADEGVAMTEEAALVSRRFGGYPGAHRSRLLTVAHLRGSDLVLTATRAHRSAVVQLMPRASRKTFTISEFARLVRAIPEHECEGLDEGSAFVEAARSLRGFVPSPGNPGHDDIDDPFLKQLEVYEAVGARLDSELGVIAARIRLLGTHR